MAEKEPLTLERDQEGKHYPSYPKPPVLDMKWANRDINVVERTNIPKFSALDDLVNPLRLYRIILCDVLVNMIFGYIKLYSRKSRH